MTEILDTSNCEIVSLGEALRTSVDFTRVRIGAGGDAVPNRAALWPTDVPEVYPYHRVGQVAVTPPLDVHFVANGVIGGPGAALKKGDAYVFNESAYPAYIKHYFSSGLRPLSWQFQPKMVRSVKGTAFQITHFNPMYGHWLLEIFPKLFAIKRLNAIGVGAPILLPKNSPSFVRHAIGLCLPAQDVLEYDHSDESLLVEKLILPPMLHRDYVFDRGVVEEIREFLATYRSGATPNRAIFISRSGIVDKFRQLRNAAELDEVAERLGMAVVRPETLSWVEQLRLFASARVLVGEYGSGMHNSIFSPPLTKVVCFNILGKIQSRIGNSFEQEVGYMLDPDGEPRRFIQGWTEQQSYWIDPAQLESKIGPLLSRSL